MRLRQLFTEHPASLGETYAEHMHVALSYAVPLLGASLAAFLHAICPFAFKTTSSVMVQRLYERMSKRCSTCPMGRLHRPDLFASGAVSSSDRRDGNARAA